jgi:hypothetical protein
LSSASCPRLLWGLALPRALALMQEIMDLEQQLADTAAAESAPAVAAAPPAH